MQPAPYSSGIRGPCTIDSRRWYPEQDIWPDMPSHPTAPQSFYPPSLTGSDISRFRPYLLNRQRFGSGIITRGSFVPLRNRPRVYVPRTSAQNYTRYPSSETRFFRSGTDARQRRSPTAANPRSFAPVSAANLSDPEAKTRSSVPDRISKLPGPGAQTSITNRAGNLRGPGDKPSITDCVGNLSGPGTKPSWTVPDRAGNLYVPGSIPGSTVPDAVGNVSGPGAKPSSTVPDRDGNPPGPQLLPKPLPASNMAPKYSQPALPVKSEQPEKRHPISDTRRRVASRMGSVDTSMFDKTAAPKAQSDHYSGMKPQAISSEGTRAVSTIMCEAKSRAQSGRVTTAAPSVDIAVGSHRSTPGAGRMTGHKELRSTPSASSSLGLLRTEDLPRPPEGGKRSGKRMMIFALLAITIYASVVATGLFLGVGAYPNIHLTDATTSTPYTLIGAAGNHSRMSTDNTTGYSTSNFSGRSNAFQAQGSIIDVQQTV